MLFSQPIVENRYAFPIRLRQANESRYAFGFLCADVEGVSAEIEALRNLGMSGYDALATATSNAGRFVGTYVDAGVHFGTLQRGARADILLLDADPRGEVDALRRPQGVMVRGQWYERSDLDRMLEQVAASR